MHANVYIRSPKRHVHWHVRNKPEQRNTHCYNNISTVTSVTYIIVIDLLFCLVRIIINNDALIHVWIQY